MTSQAALVCDPGDHTEAPDDHNAIDFGSKPVVVYDGDCGFCKLWIIEWKKHLAEKLHYAPSQLVAPRFPSIKPEEFKNAVQLAFPDNTHYGGAHAVYKILSFSDKKWHRGLLPLYEHFFPFKLLSKIGYHFIALHRPLFFSVSKHILKIKH